jgi:hypothetical protein
VDRTNAVTESNEANNFSITPIKVVQSIITISDLSPSSTVAGGSSFTLSVVGTDFVSGSSTIYWNGVAQTTVFKSSTQLTAQIGPATIAYAGTASVSVVNIGARENIYSNVLLFTIRASASPTPAISSISPVSAVAGGPGFEIQVYGSSFLPNSVVQWNGIKRFTTFLSSRQLRATIAASDIAAVSVVSVTVWSPGEIVSSPAGFALSNPTPVLTAISPPVVRAGRTAPFDLMVYGMNFDNNCEVQLDGAALQPILVSSSVLKVPFYGGDMGPARMVSVTVLKAGVASNARYLQILDIPSDTPTIIALDPDPIEAGGPDFDLKVLGQGFAPGCRVQWSGQDRETTFISANEVRAAILASDISKAGVWSVIVRNPANEVNARKEGASEPSTNNGTPIGISTVNNPFPSISRFSPSSVTAENGGFKLTIEGRGFAKDVTLVRWNDQERPATYESYNKISIDIPASDLASEGVINFSVLNPPPQGGTSGTRAFSITTNSAVQSELYFPRLVSSIGTAEEAAQNTGIAIANLSGTKPALTLRAYDRLGAEISGSEITNPVSISVSSAEQRAVSESQVFGPGMPEKNAVGWIRMQSSEKQVAGFFLVFDDALTTLDGADVSSSKMASFVFPEINEMGFNQLHVANPNPGSTGVTFELYGPDGMSRAAPVVRTVNGNGAIAEYLTSLFPEVMVSSGDYVRVNASQGMVPYSYFGEEGHDAAGLNGQDATKGAPQLYSPQYVVGGEDWNTTLSVVNLELTSANVTFRLIGDDGVQIGATKLVSIPAKGKASITDPNFFLNTGDKLVSGYVDIKSNGAKLAGSVVFGDPQRSRFMSALPLSSTLQSSILFGHVASGQIGDMEYFTGIAMLNPSDAEASAKIELYTRDGRLVTSKTVTIGAWKRKSLLLTEYFDELQGQDIDSGYIRITSNRGLASFALFGTQSLTALSAVPALQVP